MPVGLLEGSSDLAVAYVPENRVEDGCVPDFGIDENLILKDFDKPSDLQYLRISHSEFPE